MQISYLSPVVALSVFIGCSLNLSPTMAVSTETIVACPESNSDCWPNAFDFTPKANIYYAERFTGQIRINKPAKDTDSHWKTIQNIGSNGEQGVLGLALDPRWPDQKWVYVYYTKADPLKNKVVRFKEKKDGTFRRDPLITFPAASNHNGGVIRFGPDGKMYIVIGDTGDATTAQDLSALPGKVYRLNKNGTTPSDNPFEGTAQWFSWGHRNMYGLAFDPFDPNPETPEVWVTENGPECNDELNYVEETNNYGWSDLASCPNTNNSSEDAIVPVYTWEEVIAVTGADFDADGNLLIGSYNNGIILRAILNSDRDGVSSIEDYYEHGTGIVGMKADRDGAIHFSDQFSIYRLVNN